MSWKFSHSTSIWLVYHWILCCQTLWTLVGGVVTYSSQLCGQLSGGLFVCLFDDHMSNEKRPLVVVVVVVVVVVHRG